MFRSLAAILVAAHLASCAGAPAPIERTPADQQPTIQRIARSTPNHAAPASPRTEGLEPADSQAPVDVPAAPAGETVEVPVTAEQADAVDSPAPRREVRDPLVGAKAPTGYGEVLGTWRDSMTLVSLHRMGTRHRVCHRFANGEVLAHDVRREGASYVVLDSVHGDSYRLRGDGRLEEHDHEGLIEVADPVR